MTMESGYSTIPTLRSRTGSNPEEEDESQGKHHGAKGKAAFASYIRTFRGAGLSFLSGPYAPVAAAICGLTLFTVFLVRISEQGSFGARVQQSNLAITPCNTDGEQTTPFIYAYDFGGKFTDEVAKSKAHWYSEVYHAEQAFLEYVMGTSAIRTWDPEKALLFYVPFYAAFFLSCQFKDWENNMREAVMRTSEAWENVLTVVRKEYPYFNRSNGGDHFSVLSMDFGRCQALPYVEPRLYGDMFFVTMNGDKMLRSTHTHFKRNMQILSYNYGTHGASDIPDIPCYRSDLDIVAPPTLEDSVRRPMRITTPFEGDRTITVVMRFKVEHHHKQTVHHHNHYIRKELYDLYHQKGLEGWEFGVKEPEKIFREDLTKSLFCVCPPGHSQWTARLSKAIMAGCIPITFFRDCDSPWQDELDYSQFSINVDPDELNTLFDRVENTLRNPRRLLSMQRNLERVQRLFAWNETDPLATQNHLSRVLWCKAKRLDKGPIGNARREARRVSKTHRKPRAKPKKVP